MKKLFTLVFILITVVLYAREVEIDGECAYLDEILGAEYPSVSIMCGFQPGDTKRVSSSMIASSLKRAGLAVPAMPDVYIVTRTGVELSDSIVESEVKSLYEAAYPGSVITVESFRMGKKIFLGDGSNYIIEVNTDKLGSISGTVKLDNTKTSFYCSVKLYDYVFVSTSVIEKGELLSDKTEFKLVDITNLRNSPVLDIKNLVASKRINKGQIISDDLTAEKADRKRGDPITLIYVSNNLQVEISAIANSDAVVGKTFQVKNPDTGKIIQAKYIGDGKAIVE